MAALEVTSLADQDIREILAWTEEQFGSAARTRYETLITTAFRDLERDPLPIGSRPRSELGASLRTYHLRHSRVRAQSPSGRVDAPRHVIFYFLPDPDMVVVVRVLHDAMDPNRHLAISVDD